VNVLVEEGIGTEVVVEEDDLKKIF